MRGNEDVMVTFVNILHVLFEFVVPSKGLSTCITHERLWICKGNQEFTPSYL